MRRGKQKTKTWSSRSQDSTWGGRVFFLRVKEMLDNVFDKVNELTRRAHKFTLIFVFSNAAQVWKDEILINFSNAIILRVFIGFRIKASLFESNRVLGSRLPDLLDYFVGLTDIFVVRRVIILSTYQTWIYRTAYLDDESRGRRQRESKAKLDEEHDEEKRSKEELQTWHSYVPSVFGRLILNEAQKITFSRTVTFKQAFDMDVPV